jgi:hypothetical protein
MNTRIQKQHAGPASMHLEFCACLIPTKAHTKDEMKNSSGVSVELVSATYLLSRKGSILGALHHFIEVSVELEHRTTCTVE